MFRLPGWIAAGLVLCAATALPVSAAAGERVKVTGEVIDTWCYITEIMFPEGSAHHQCAVWCAAGGIPVGILGDDGTVYMVLKVGDDATRDLMTDFYRRLWRDREEPHRALWRARMAARARKVPFGDWAGWVLVGR